MSKGKAKVASKNNPEGRGQVKEYFHNGKKIKPVKLVMSKGSYFAAEYEDSGDLVLGPSGQVLPWASARNLG